MKNNKTIKALQLEIDKIQQQLKLKTSKGKTSTDTTNDIKHSYIQNLHMKSSMFMLWIFTAVLSYASKIPYIKQIVSGLSVVYGRTTIWKVLVKLRKAFILFNAAIGVYLTFKTVGFSYDNILAGFAGMGHNYLELFTNFTKRLFNWFVELFDHKVIPNVPGESGGNNIKKIWGNTPIDKSAFNPQYPSSGRVENSLRESYKSLLNIQVEPTYTPWYKDYSKWMWIIGGVFVVYLGYKFIIDPLFIHEVGRDVTGTDPRFGKAGPSNLPDITLNDSRGVTETVTDGVRNFFESINKKATRVYGGIRWGINPINWILPSYDTSQGFKVFMEKQNVMETSERHLYPFTNINPYLPWYEQLKVKFFGESVIENLTRFKAMAKADRIVESLSVSKGKMREVVGGTPNIWGESVAATGLNTPIPRLSFVDAVHSINIQNKLNSIPSTPTITPSILPISENILADVSEWKSHSKGTFTENNDNWLKVWKEAKPVLPAIEVPAKILLPPIEVPVNPVPTNIVISPNEIQSSLMA